MADWSQIGNNFLSYSGYDSPTMTTTIRPQTQPVPPNDRPWSALQKAATKVEQGPEDTLHIDTIRWDIENQPNGETIEKGVFKDAFIQPKKLKDVYLMIKPFTDQPMNAPGHALLKFEFEADAPVTNSEGQKEPALILSVEQHFHQGEAYDPNAKNPVIFQLGTWSDALEKANLHDHNPLQSYKLKLNDEQKQAWLLDRLTASVTDHDKDMYDPILNSCLSNIIDSLNTLVPEHQQIPRTMPDGSPDPSATVPIWCANTFKAHGLLAQNTPDVYPAIPKPPEEPPANPPAGGQAPKP